MELFTATGKLKKAFFLTARNMELDILEED